MSYRVAGLCQGFSAELIKTLEFPERSLSYANENTHSGPLHRFRTGLGHQKDQCLLEGWRSGHDQPPRRLTLSHKANDLISHAG